MRFLLLICALLLSFNVLALDRDIEIDIIAKRLTTLLMAGNSAEALPLFEKLEAMKAVLPESFDYYYVDTLDKSGNAARAYERGQAYLEKYGKKGRYYDRVVEIYSRLSGPIERQREAEKARLLQANAERIKKEAALERERVAAEATAKALEQLEGQLVRIGYAPSFMMSKFEVTQALWRAVMGSDPVELEQAFRGCDACAVTNVSWDDAKAFISRLNARTQGAYRLPSVAEWNFACSAGEKQSFCGSDTLDEVAWFAGNSGGRPHPVGQKNANAWGLHDMSGNVMEWTEDCMSASRCDYRELRGSAWRYTAASQGIARIWWSPAARRDNDTGFRLARTLP